MFRYHFSTRSMNMDTPRPHHHLITRRRPSLRFIIHEKAEKAAIAQRRRIRRPEHAQVVSPAFKMAMMSISASKYGCTSASAFGARVGNKASERGAFVVRNAASKEKKSRDLNMLKGMLNNEDTMLVAGFRYEGLSVRYVHKDDTEQCNHEADAGGGRNGVWSRGLRAFR